MFSLPYYLAADTLIAKPFFLRIRKAGRQLTPTHIGFSAALRGYSFQTT